MIQLKSFNAFGRQTVYGKWTILDTPLNRLYYVHSGDGCVMHNEREYVLEAGFLYLIPFTVSFVPHSNIDNPLDHSYVDFELIPPIMSEYIYKLDPECTPMTKLLCDLFLQIVGNKKNSHYIPPNADKYLVDLLSATTTYLAKQFVDTYNIKIVEDKLAISILNDLNDSIDRDISINEIAKKYYMAPDTIIKRFKKCFNLTPYAYLKELRLRTAAHLINSGEKLSEAAQATNYADSSSLAHALKKITSRNNNDMM